MKQTVWEKLMIERLRTIEIKKQSYESTCTRLLQIKEEAQKMNGPVLSSTPVSGGKYNREEERRLNNLALQEELEINIKQLRTDIRLHERNWAKLDKKEQLVLHYFFVDRPHNYIDQLMLQLHCERATVYRIKDDAMYKLTMLTYGDS